ncbi:unnamed protein product [Cuscuta campestris]|uniref:Uncharacterized protein n=1 Tax=Cuscuta campestris TaxID=132261 RepID=A0A484MHK3_9ASTE|nr:unnamed protein product [Cuscuta campestris]
MIWRIKWCSPAKERSAVRALRRKSSRQEVGRRVPQRVCGGARWTKTKKEDLQVVPCVESLPDERRSGGASREVIATAVQDDLADQMV